MRVPGLTSRAPAPPSIGAKSPRPDKQHCPVWGISAFLGAVDTIDTMDSIDSIDTIDTSESKL